MVVKKRRGQSAAFMARIRKLRGKSNISKSVTKSYRRLNMAKKRSGRRKSKSIAGTSGMLATGMGVGGYILFESMIEPKLLQMANISNPLAVNAIELMAGVWASRKGGVIGSIGKAAVVINLYQIMYPYLSTLGKSQATTSNLFG